MYYPECRFRVVDKLEKIMTRQILIDSIGFCGYHEDKKRYTRLIIENRISLPIAQEAYRQGIAKKRAGWKCECFECKKLSNL